MSFIAGYKFKETHPQIHYLKSTHGKKTDPYTNNFSMDQATAKIFETYDVAQKWILEFMSHFEKETDYRWTPVITNTKTNENTLIIHSKWHEMYLFKEK